MWSAEYRAWHAVGALSKVFFSHPLFYSPISTLTYGMMVPLWPRGFFCSRNPNSQQSCEGSLGNQASLFPSSLRRHLETPSGMLRRYLGRVWASPQHWRSSRKEKGSFASRVTPKPDSLSLSLFLNFFLFGCTARHVGSRFPHQGSNLSPLYWKLEVVTTGPSRKFSYSLYWISQVGWELGAARGCVPSHFNRVWLFATQWTVALQAPLSTRVSRQEYWSGLPFPSPGSLPEPGIKPKPLMSPAEAGVCTTSVTWEAGVSE